MHITGKAKFAHVAMSQAIILCVRALPEGRADDAVDQHQPSNTRLEPL